MKLSFFALLLLAASCATLPTAPEGSWTEPIVTSRPLEVCWLEVAGKEVPGGFGTAGATRAETWQVTASALLIRHPEGDVLIDSGVSPEMMKDAAALPLWNWFLLGQMSGSFSQRGSLTELLERAGVSPARLKAVVLSHAHPDHSGGVLQLPGVPFLVGAGERGFVGEEANWSIPPQQGKALLAAMQEVTWTPRPFANFERSFDVFGDGSVVLVPLPGHTPGSMGTFVRLSGDRRLLHVGDIFSLTESLDRGVPKSSLMSALTDEDADMTHQAGARIVQWKERDPALQVIPAHDRTAWEQVFGARAIGNGAPWCLSAEVREPTAARPIP